MTSTPERKDSTGSFHSTRSLVFGSTRRYSRAYDQPIISHTYKGPKVRVEDMDGGLSSSNSLEVSKRKVSADSLGKILNPEGIQFGNLLARITVSGLFVLALVIYLIGNSTLIAASQLFGFIFMFSTTFILSSALFLWWASTNKDTSPLSLQTVPCMYIAGLCSSMFSQAIAYYTSFPMASSLPIDATYYVFHITLLFLAFSLLIHRDSLNGMFAQETCLFVGLSVVLDFVTMCLFGDVLPCVVYVQLPLSSMLMGLSLSLAGETFPYVTPSALFWGFQQALTYKAGASSHHPTTARSKRVSDVSITSSAFPRTSVSSYSSFGVSQGGQHESELITEAHGLISDLLLTKETLNTDAQTKLKRVVELLNPRVERSNGLRRVKVGDHISSDRHDYEDDIYTTVSDASAFSSGQVSSGQISSGQSSNRLSVVNPKMMKHRSSSSVYQRQSVSTFSVATSASGMPVLDSEPMDRKRSVALREVKARISIQEKKHSVHKMSRERLGSIERLSKPGTPTRTSSQTSPLSKFISTPELVKTDTEASDGESVKSGDVSQLSTSSLSSLDGRQPVATPPESPNWTGGRGSIETSLGVISEEGGEQRPRSNTAPTLSLITSPLSGQREQQEEVDSGAGSQFWVGRGERPPCGYTVFNRFTQPPDYELSDYSQGSLAVLEQVGSWDFPIFELEEKAGDHILSQMAFVLFQESGLMETFKIPHKEFINFFRVLEANYGSNVYHNKTHAADVLHGVSYLLWEMIPGFSHAFSGGNEREWKQASTLGKTVGGNIASAFPILEVFACYMAAAMHDFDHPGRTNAFLVATKSPLAILYNDRSVLENHHAAASWDLLTCVPAHNCLSSLDEAELKRFRFLVMEAILATDLKMHFGILANFKQKTHPEDGEGIDWSSEVDRLMVMKIIIKMADINTPTKSISLHRSWTERITEEFYQQADQEKELGLPPTIFMDRNSPEKLPAIQLSFIQHLVSPLFQAAATAGIIPGILEAPTPEPDNEDPDDTELAVEHKEEGLDLGDDAFTMQDEQRSAQKFMSILLTNLEVNYDKWREELPAEDKDATEEKKEQTTVKDEDNAESAETDDVVTTSTDNTEN